MKAVIEKIMNSVDRDEDEIMEMLKKLVQIPSVSGEEEKIAKFIAGKMREFGFMESKIDSAGNVIGVIKGVGKKSLLFHGHLDHVEPGDMPDPYSAKILSGERFDVEGDVIYGRGSCDAKGSLCSMLMACKTLLEERIPLKGNLTLAGVVMEESGGSRGTKKLLEYQNFETAIVGEPTDLNIALGHKGGAFLYLKVKGVSGHVGRASECINALDKSLKILNKIKEEVVPRFKRDDKLGATTLTFTNIKVRPGFVSIIPNESLVEFDVRYTPSQPPNQIISEIRKCIMNMRKDDPEIDAEVDYITVKKGNQEYKEDIPPFYTPSNIPQVKILRKIIKYVTNKNAKSILWPFATDGAFISKAGSVTLGFGPGDYRVVHSENEYVKIESLIQATKIYALSAINLLGM